MLWEIEISPRGADAERARVLDEFQLLTHSPAEAAGLTRTARGYLLEGELSREQTERLAGELLVDSVVEQGHLAPLQQPPARPPHATVLLKPGVMDPVA